ncbi:alpha/beta fold hydrolase [Antrihabitans sp. YC2-6]|uniref:lipase family alpha/beta hydrolase n=1 Tax=Antrihabitans sp. YC2-6 TaxID=2799498 RepID=UPI0018F55B44|nr:alpha/beta fold hydrolase [Antrihabitans sp. YC2-6]MBJ8346563.1 alpha/beta fold hydrolase [Antrihabitans sp. YC2-6]
MVDVAERKREVRALSQLAFDELGGAVGGIAKMHRAISDRIFSVVGFGIGSAQAPIKALHDAISEGVYTAVSGTTSLASEASSILDLPLASPPSETAWGAGIIAAIQGLRGDTLEAEQPALAEAMTLRVDGKYIAAEPSVLAETFPAPSARLVVFLHGLMESEYAWRLGGRPSYGEQLGSTYNCTPLHIRYNTGRHISENARSFAALLAEIVDTWPVEVEEIAIVGHSMGGLVARSACHIAQTDHAPWAGKVRQVVCLGSPHFGAPLERLVHYASAGLTMLPETAPIGRFLRRRSNGIRDLRLGSLVDEDWSGRDKDALRAAVCVEVPLLVGATHYFVSATVTRSPRHPMGKLLGDGLVLTSSATGRTRSRRIGFEDSNGLHISPANHFTLLNNDVVYDKLRSWLNPIVISNGELEIC